MIGLHNTQLKKTFSDSLQTNALQPVNLIASEVIQPTIEIEPYSNIVRKESGTGTLLPATSRNFILKGVSISTDSATTSITITPEDNPSISIDCVANAATLTDVTTNNLNINFGKGLKLEKNTSITLSVAASGGMGMIWGYYLDERAS